MTPPKFSARRIGGLLTVASICAFFVVPASASAFGTVSGILGQHAEHERVTRLALQCANGKQPPDCFQPVSLDNVAGKGGSYGAVGAPDDLPMHLTVDREYWHCDNADYADPATYHLASYPQSRSAALDKLRDCIAWGKSKLYDGGGNWSLPPATPSGGAVGLAKELIRPNGKVDNSNPGVGIFSSTCTYNGVKSSRYKCNVLEPFGYVLHMAEDFYSHTNWADLSIPGQRLSITNPYGLGYKTVAPFLDLRANAPSDADIPENFTGGCYPKKHCSERIIHGESSGDQGLNKDKSIINTTTGAVTDPNTPRGAVVVDGIFNSQRAVDVAVLEARRQWEVLRAEIVQRYGSDRGAKMVCVLVLDKAEACNTRSLVVAIDANPPRRGSTAKASASAVAGSPTIAAGQRIVQRLARTDRVSVVTFDRGGAQDVDPFVAPARARFDDPVRGDAAPDPSTEPGKEGSRAADPTFAGKPDQPSEVPSAPGSYTHGSEEGASVSALRSGRSGGGALAALRAAGAQLVNSKAPRGQRGVVLVTTSLPRALAPRIRALGKRGASVSVAYYGKGKLSRALIRAVESTGGTAVATRDAAQLRRFANAADAAGLTRLDDALPEREAPLAIDYPVLYGITGTGSDTHPIAAQKRPRKVRVQTQDAPLRVVLTNHRTGKSRQQKAPRGGSAAFALPAGGNYEVAIEAKSGHRYGIVIQPRPY